MACDHGEREVGPGVHIRSIVGMVCDVVRMADHEHQRPHALLSTATPCPARPRATPCTHTATPCTSTTRVTSAHHEVNGKGHSI